MVASSTCPLPYALSWYLDVSSPGWHALILDDYKIIMPLTITQKAGLSFFLQPLFTQQLGLFYSHQIELKQLNEFLEFIKKKYRLIVVNIHNYDLKKEDLKGFRSQQMITYRLSLAESYTDLTSCYSENHRRNIRKAVKAGLKFNEKGSLERFFDLYNLELKDKISGIDKRKLTRMESLMQNMLNSGHGQIYEAHDPAGQPLASMFAVQNADTFVYLFAAAAPIGKQFGASHFLVDRFIERKSGNKDGLLDFEGSMIEGIARFYKGFGAVPNHYWQIRRNRLPWFLKWIIKW